VVGKVQKQDFLSVPDINLLSGWPSTEKQGGLWGAYQGRLRLNFVIQKGKKETVYRSRAVPQGGRVRKQYWKSSGQVRESAQERGIE